MEYRLTMDAVWILWSIFFPNFACVRLHHLGLRHAMPFRCACVWQRYSQHFISTQYTLELWQGFHGRKDSPTKIHETWKNLKNPSCTGRYCMTSEWVLARLYHWPRVRLAFRSVRDIHGDMTAAPPPNYFNRSFISIFLLVLWMN